MKCLARMQAVAIYLQPQRLAKDSLNSALNSMYSSKLKQEEVWCIHSKAVATLFGRTLLQEWHNVSIVYVNM